MKKPYVGVCESCDTVVTKEIHGKSKSEIAQLDLSLYWTDDATAEDKGMFCRKCQGWLKYEASVYVKWRHPKDTTAVEQQPTEQPQEDGQCPLCFRHFPMEQLEHHAQQCTGEESSKPDKKAIVNEETGEQMHFDMASKAANILQKDVAYRIQQDQFAQFQQTQLDAQPPTTSESSSPPQTSTSKHSKGTKKKDKAKSTTTTDEVCTPLMFQW
eukprot:TRINITY_DN57782_c0_g1_i2.p1 TRINITY_DN57782_c0_g1~~TRINITY_DN57782_c0_g1_i2.p1  ORF type:complete len:220 (+),score=23.54 TRINITY_DN57782_c0_g1_i2:22-660(+)